MKRNIVRQFLFGASALLLMGASFIAMHMGVRANTNTDSRITLASNTSPLLAQAQFLQAADPNQQLNLSIALQLRNSADLDNLLSAIYDPQSPQYHQYLTPDQFNTLFAPTPDTVQQVVTFLQSQGLTITNIASNNLFIDATGSVAQAQQAFQVQINNYTVGNTTFYANATAPSVPGSISPLISSIDGLNDSVQYHPLYQRLDAQTTARQQRRVSATTPSGYGPKELAGAYDIKPLQDAVNSGDKQTVALFELDGYSTSDVQQYFQTYNLGTPSITPIQVDGFNSPPGQGAIEVELDIEVVAAVAPQAKQLVYEGPNTIQGLNDTYNKIVTDNKAQIVSISWGLCEASLGNAELQSLDNIFKQGATQGISFFAAAGDSGAYDCNDSNLAVDSPADDPYITGVGGTNLQLNNGAYGSEAVWSNPNDTHRSPKGAGGGGGISSLWQMQSWQRGPGVMNTYSSGTPCSAGSGKYCREVPDVSGNADPATGYAMYCTVTNAGCPATGWMTVGGTSPTAPLWAASAALMNQYLQSQNQPSQNKTNIGYANLALYNLFNSQQAFPAFHDITSGSNLYYPATGGYDQASGMGSPDVYNLARDLAAAGSPPSNSTPTPVPTPTNTPIPTPTNTPSPTPTPPLVVIQNGDFENGVTPWQEWSSAGYELVQSLNTYSGAYSAYLCGYAGCNDRIWQVFTVPANYTKITITYWWYSDTTKTTKKCQDNFTSQLQTTSASTISTIESRCNTNVTNGWVQKSFDASSVLTQYKGKQARIFFAGTTDNQYQTSDFFVDLVDVKVS